MRAEKSEGERSVSLLRALNRDLFGALVIMWMISFLRVVLGIARHERFGTDGSLALLAIVVVPWLAKDALVASWRDWRGRFGSPQPPNGS